MNTKIAWLLLGLLLGICIVVAITLWIPETPASKAFAHPDYATMQRGGDGVKRHGRILWLGWAFGVLQFCFFAGLIALSVNKQRRIKIFAKPILTGLFLNILVFCLMMFAYWNYARQGTGPFFGSFPLPTALMLYGVWPIQLIFVVIYVWYFNRAIFTEDDLEKFQAIVRSRREQVEEEN